MKVNIKMMKMKDMEQFIILMKGNMKESLKIINSMYMVLKLIQMETNLLVDLKMI